MDQDLGARFFALLGPLLGAIVGGLISIVATQMLEHRRRRHERREKLDALRREALSGALEWVEPMRQAHARASSLVVAALHGNVDDERLLTDWPYLLGDLVKKDLSGSQRAVLPDDAYARGHRIVRELDSLRNLGVRYAQEVQAKRQPMVGLVECGAKLDALAAEISRLEADLRREFRATFE